MKLLGDGTSKSTGSKLRLTSAQPLPSGRLLEGPAPLLLSGKLRPEKQSRQDRRFEKAGVRVEKTAKKLGKAKEALRKQKPRHGAGPARVLAEHVGREIHAFAHGKIHEVEGENIGVEAAHRAELAGESAYRSSKRTTLRRRRTRPARRVRKWEKQHIRARADRELLRQMREHPELKSNPVSRFLQKKRLQKQYRKEIREAARNGVRSAVKRVKETAEKAAKSMLLFAKRHPTGLMIFGGVFAVILLLQSCMALALSMGGALGGSSGAAYAGDSVISAAMLRYSEWEADLLLEATTAEDSRPGFSDYVYSLDPVGTSTDELLAYLAVKHQGAALPDVETALQSIFADQYALSFIESGTILTVELVATPFSEVIAPLLTPDELAEWEALRERLASGSLVGSPFPLDWTAFITSRFGYRIHPISGEKDFHQAIDISQPEGTQILAGGKGTVLEATFHSLYGNYLLVDYGGGIAARYSHCSALLVSAGSTVKPGDVLALVGSTGASTGPHLDLEIMLDGIHVNPIYFVATA